MRPSQTDSQITSRPSSRLSSSSLRNPSAAAGSAQHVRASSSMSISTSMAPFTPGPGPRSASSMGANGRSSRLGLSAKQVDRLSETIASVQRGVRGDGDGLNEDQVANGGNRNGRDGDRGSHAPAPGRDRKGKAKASIAPNASFIAEASFVDAPLNSRINSTRQVSPRKKAVLPRKHAQQPLTSTRLRQIISGTDEVEDDEADLQQYIEDEQVAEEKAETGDDLGEADLAIQEALLIEDLLSVLLGIQGQVITVDPEYNPEDEVERLQGVRFVIDEQIDPSLQDLAARILPLATHYTSISYFLDLYQHASFGLTSHALCSAIRSVLSEYLTLVAQLEEQFSSSPSFTLQRFWVFVQPVLHKLFLVQALVEDITGTSGDGDASTEDASGQQEDESDEDDRFGGGAALREAMKAMGTGDTNDKAKGWAAGGPVKGGEILAIIDERLQRTSGDPVASSVYSTLLLKASQPYAQTLLKWISTGQLSDPYDEFMIRESKNVNLTSLDQDYVDEYWERKYTLKNSSLVASAGPLSGDGQEERGILGDLGNLASTAVNGGGGSGILEKRTTKRENGLGGGAIIPSFLERWKIKILMAGKYLNVIRECGTSELKEIMQIQASQVAGSNDRDGQEGDTAIDSDSFTARIDSAYLSANTALLRLLISQQSLFPRLRSLKHHFFLDQGDSFTHFLDLAHTELAKKSKHVSLSKLQSLLDLAIRNPSSASGGDPYKEDVRVAMAGTTLTDWLLKIENIKGALGGHEKVASSVSEAEFALPELGAGSSNSINSLNKEKEEKKKDEKNSLTGIEALSLDYTVKFPLSLVISRKAILRYQLIFRHLLSLKHFEQVLTSMWAEHTRNPAWRKRSSHLGLEKWKNRVFTLRARMLAFVQQMFAFAVSEVMEGNWRNLMQKLETVATVDGLLGYHSDFLDTCLKECMLTQPALLKIQAKLLSTISSFAQYKARLAQAAARVARTTEEAIERGEDWRSVSIASEEDSLQRFEIHFYKHQKAMADRVQFHAFSDTNALLALLVRLASTLPASDGGL